jgi:AmmeMemoRadiSam system protein A
MGEPYSQAERACLLAIARKSIQSRLTGTAFWPQPLTPRLREARGIFATLYSSGGLRGCIGYPFAEEPLYHAVAEAAAAAALHDPRFRAVTLAEAPQLRIALSVLSSMAPIGASEIQIGRHGLMVTCGAVRGLLLPQVAVEQGWNAQSFLENTCRKAGLLPEAWKAGRVEAFTADVFGD